MNNLEVEYKVSIRNSKYFGYHNIKQNEGNVKVAIGNLWEYCNEFEKFVDELVYLIILERICLERAFQKIKMKNRCKPFCKMEVFALHMFNQSRKE